jgi:demethylmenaquinone methyltransferase/2-methoxy-6-polyprenyl-1,4-benzoquinol methylase
LTEQKPSGSPAVRRMFSSIAGRYDLLNRLFSFGTDVRWRRELASEIGPGDGYPILDLATGTADVALTLEKEREGQQLIVGADFTLPMLKIGARKVEHREAKRIRLTAGDAYALPFVDDTFDAVTIAFGLRNLSYRVDGLREMLRVLRPGGRLVILEFTPIDRPIIGPLFNFYFHKVMPVIGGIISGDLGAYRYLPRSVEAFPNPIALGQEMIEAGFEEIKYRPLTLGIACLHVGEKTSYRGNGVTG